MSEIKNFGKSFINESIRYINETYFYSREKATKLISDFLNEEDINKNEEYYGHVGSHSEVEDIFDFIVAQEIKKDIDKFYTELCSFIKKEKAEPISKEQVNKILDGDEYNNFRFIRADLNMSLQRTLNKNFDTNRVEIYKFIDKMSYHFKRFYIDDMIEVVSKPENFSQSFIKSIIDYIVSEYNCPIDKATNIVNNSYINENVINEDYRKYICKGFVNIANEILDSLIDKEIEEKFDMYYSILNKYLLDNCLGTLSKQEVIDICNKDKYYVAPFTVEGLFVYVCQRRIKELNDIEGFDEWLVARDMKLSIWAKPLRQFYIDNLN